MASAPGSLCPVQPVNSVGLPEQFISCEWSAEDQLGNKSALKHQSLGSVVTEPGVPITLDAMATGAAANNVVGTSPHILQGLQTGNVVKGAYQGWGMLG